MTLAWLVGDASYRWMVGSIEGIEALGRFAAAQGIVLVINPLLITANNLAQAWSAKAFAQGGIAAALGPDDEPNLHAADTTAAGDGLCDDAAVRVLAHEGPRYVRELIDWGAPYLTSVWKE